MFELLQQIVDQVVDGVGRFGLGAVRFLRQAACKVESVHVERIVDEPAATGIRARRVVAVDL